MSRTNVRLRCVLSLRSNPTDLLSLFTLTLRCALSARFAMAQFQLETVNGGYGAGVGRLLLFSAVG